MRPMSTCTGVAVFPGTAVLPGDATGLFSWDAEIWEEVVAGFADRHPVIGRRRIGR